jgi:hypothetical protein
LTSHHLCGWTSACCTPPYWTTRWRSSGVCMLTCAKPSRPRSLPRRTACGRPPRRRRRGWVRSTGALARSSHTCLYLTAVEGACAAAAAYVRRELSVYAAAHPELTPDDATTALKKQWHDMLPDAQEVRAALPRRHAYAHYRVHIRPHTMGIVLLVGGDDGGGLVQAYAAATASATALGPSQSDGPEAADAGAGSQAAASQSAPGTATTRRCVNFPWAGAPHQLTIRAFELANTLAVVRDEMAYVTPLPSPPQGHPPDRHTRLRTQGQEGSRGRRVDRGGAAGDGSGDSRGGAGRVPGRPAPAAADARPAPRVPQGRRRGHEHHQRCGHCSCRPRRRQEAPGAGQEGWQAHRPQQQQQRRRQQ